MQVHSESTAFYRHSKRPEWGLAILTAELGHKRRYQFEDGELRTIADGYYHLLEAAPPPADADNRVAKLLLERDLGRSRRRLAKMTPDARSGIVTLRQQIEWFEENYPEGFVGERWTDEHRGPDVKTPRKRHRDPVLAAAPEVLSEDALLAVDEENAEAWMKDLVALLRKTDLVRKKEVDGMLASKPERLAKALLAWLYEDGPRDRAFIDLLQAVSEPSWALVTTFGALARPGHHVAVSSASFTRLAQFMAPKVGRIAGTPNFATYRKVLGMMRIVRLQLRTSGLKPRDLVDVRDFLVATLRPKVIDAIQAQHAFDEPTPELAS